MAVLDFLLTEISKAVPGFRLWRKPGTARLCNPGKPPLCLSALKPATRKVKASTLMETLVATLLLIMVFGIASLTVNTLFGNTVKYNTRPVITYMNELEYRYRHGGVPLPYTETYEHWEIHVSGEVQEGMYRITFEAVGPESQKTLTKTIISHAKTP